jgi:molecular chaperone GrpE (heat shock protein)
MSGSLPEINDKDFAAQMEKLAAQAVGDPASKTAGAAGQSDGMGAADRQIVAEIASRIAPLVVAVEALGRESARQRHALESMEKVTKKYESELADASRAKRGREERGAIETKMFSALHEELKTYKDEFLVDVLQKPVVSGMMSLHDDLCEVCRQVKGLIEGTGLKARDDGFNNALGYIAANLEHAVHHLLEVMSRIGVEVIDLKAGKLDRQQQKAVAVEEASVRGEDGDVVRRLRRGFTWRNRVFRPEEVVIKKYAGSTGEQTGADDENP